MRYSASTNGFYAEDIDYQNLPYDCVEISDAAYDFLMLGQANGKFIAPNADGVPILVGKEDIPQLAVALEQESVVRQYLNAGAQTKHYDSITTACSYANSANVTFKSDADTCIAWRDDCWEHYLIYVAGVESGASVWTDEALISYLPKLVWPVDTTP